MQWVYSPWRSELSFFFVFSTQMVLLFAVKTSELCSTNDQRSRVWCQHWSTGGWPHYCTGRDNRWVTSTAFLGSCRQQSHQFNIQILRSSSSMHEFLITIPEFMDSSVCHSCTSSFLTEKHPLSVDTTHEYSHTFLIKWKQLLLRGERIVDTFACDKHENLRGNALVFIKRSSRRVCPLV